VIFSRSPGTFEVMRQPVLFLFVVMVAAANSSPTYASGSSAGTVPASARQHSSSRAGTNQTRVFATNSSQPAVAEEPYTLGKALYSGKYNLGTPKLTEANAKEKMQRLVTLQRTLPASEKKKMNPATLSQRLTNREMNALEYYLRIRFGKFITKSPSWARAEPPPEIASAP
jgi:hypothetical protein